MIIFLATYYDCDTEYDFGIEIKCSINDVVGTDYSIWEFALHKALEEANKLGVMLMNIKFISM